MFVQMLGVFAEFERATIVERVIAGMERKAATGAWVGGYRPFGNEPDRESGVLVPREEEAPLVQVIFDLYANKRLGSRAIATCMNKRGYRTKTGRPWGHTAVITVLTNRAYVGEIFFRGRYYPAPHPPVVDDRLFEAAHAVLEARGENLSLRKDERLGLSAHRSHRVRTLRQALHWRPGQGESVPIPLCFSRHRHGTSEYSQERLRAEELEERVVESLLTTLERRERLEEALRRWTDQISEGRPKRERELAAVDARIRKAETALDRYFRAFENARLSEDV